MKKVISLVSIFIIYIFFFSSALFAYDTFFIDIGASPYTTANYYLYDLRKANDTNYFSQLSKPSLSLQLGLYHRGFYGHLDDNLLVGGSLSTGFHEISKKNATTNPDETAHPTTVGYNSLSLDGFYYFNKICTESFLKFSLAAEDIDVQKDINGSTKYKMISSAFIGAKIGCGYAFQTNPDESAIQTGIDICYFQAPYKKYFFGVVSTQIYVSFLW